MQDPNDWGTGYNLHRPTERTRLLLARWQLQDRRFWITRFHIARDERMDNIEQLADRMDDLWDCLRLKNVARWERYRVQNNGLNFYLKKFAKEKDVCVYRRINSLVVRSELRFINSKSVERAGFSNMHRLSDLDPEEVFHRHVYMV